jgi:hypothetical protein
MPDLDKLLAAIDAAEENAYGSDNDGGLAQDRALLINLYIGQNVDPAPTGRSQVVDRSVFETIQWILPSLCRIYANGSDLVAIPPLGPDDEAAAKQEAEYINHVVQDRNPWFELFNTWSTDALLTRNAYFYAYRDKKRNTEIERYERQTEAGVALLLQDKDVEVIDHKAYPSDEEPQPVLDEATGQMVMPPPEMLYDIELRRVEEHGEVCIKVLPPERVKVSQYTPSYRLADCPYFEFYDDVTLSDLRAEGFDVDDDIASDEASYETEEDQARDLYTETREDDHKDPAMRRVRRRAIWVKHDYDEDGIAELQYVIRVGREILFREEVGAIPVACAVPSPLPHRHVGMSVGDMVADVQRIKTAILRQGLDNLYLSNNPQKVYNQNVVNLDDLMTSVPGGHIRVDGDPDQVRYEKHPFVFPEAMQGLEYMDQIRENRAGVNRYFTGVDQNSLNKTATGIQTLSTMAAQRVEQLARILGSGIEDLARIVHELILKGGHKKEVVKLKGEWVEVDPAQWKKRSDFKISVGFASGNKDAMVSRLMMIAQNQYQALELGLPIVEPQNLHETMLELTKASDFSSPERFWTDPKTAEPKPQPPNPDLMKLQLEGTVKEAELEMQQEASASELQLKQQELALKQAEMQAQLELEKYKIDKQAETQIILAQLGHQQAVELADRNAEHDAGQQMMQHAHEKETAEKPEKDDDTEQVKKAVSETKDKINLAKMVDSLTQAVETLNRPRKVVRDKSGRIDGVE